MEILDTLKQFAIKESVVGYFPLGNGHINVTYFVMTKNKKCYVLQKINNNVFKDVDQLMNNIYLTTNFLVKKGYETLELVPTKNSRLYYQDGDDYYRVYTYIDDVICYEGVDDLDAVYNTAKAFGRLHKSLFEFDAQSLYEVIPNFHNTEKRYQTLLKSEHDDVCHRVSTCLEEIKALDEHADKYSLFNELIKKGEVKIGVTHNDPKINNVLFDKATNDIRAVIDLDTMMPGSYLYDYGDALRSLFTGEYEDSKDLNKIRVDIDIFKAYTRGYLSEMGELLTKKEKELLPFAIYLLTAELGIRFLTDYLDGDTYFRTAYPEHNLIRARTQIKLAQEIYSRLDELNEIVKQLDK